jgi:hypothetical protein
MSKSILSADDFLTALAGEATDYDLPGVGVVKIRPIPYIDTQRLLREHAGDEMALMMGALVAGLVEPQLSEADIERLQRGATGPVIDLARRIMAISGMGPREELENLAGGGS